MKASFFFFFLGSVEESPEHRSLSKQEKEGVCHGRPGRFRAGPVGLGQEQEFPTQTDSLLPETGAGAPQKATLFPATK